MTYQSLFLSVLLVPTLMANVLLVATTTAEEPKRLIIHADDAGMSHSVNVATIDALEKGIVSSASIMVPCPWFKEFAVYAKAHPEFDYGIHLTLNSEWDVYRWGSVANSASVPSLLDPEGYLWDNTTLVGQHAKAEEVRIELKAQIDKALAFGVPLSHLDTHMGALMSRPDLVEVYVQLGIEYKLPVLFFAKIDPAVAQAYPALAARHAAALPKLAEAGLPVVDNLLQFYGGEIPAKRLEVYQQALRSLPAGVTELIIHCGVDNPELQAITGSAARRDQDYRIFIDPATKRLLAEEKIELINWKQLRELDAKARK